MDREQVWVVLGDAIRKTMFTRNGLIEVWSYPGHRLHQNQLGADRAHLFRLVFRNGVLILIEPL